MMIFNDNDAPLRNYWITSSLATNLFSTKHILWNTFVNNIFSARMLNYQLELQTGSFKSQNSV